MKTFIFDDDINMQSAREFLDWAVKLNEGEPAKVILETYGGACAYQHVIIDTLNANLNIEVHVVNKTYSGGSEVFLRCKNKKKIGPYFRYIMVHHIVFQKDLIRKHSNYGVDRKALKRMHKKSSKFWKKILKKKEYARYIAGKDVYLDYNRVKKIIK